MRGLIDYDDKGWNSFLPGGAAPAGMRHAGRTDEKTAVCHCFSRGVA